MTHAAASINEYINMQEAQPCPNFGFGAAARFTTHNASLRRCSENAAQITARKHAQQQLHRKRRPRRAGQEQFDLLSQPKKMDSGRLKAKQAREERSEMQEDYTNANDFCFRPETMENGSAPFVTQFHLERTDDLRNVVAKDQNKERHIENAPELIDSVAQKEHRPPFITAVGSLTSKMPSKFQLEIERARATRAMHKGCPPVGAHRFRDEAPGNFNLYFHGAKDKNKGIANQEDNRQRTKKNVGRKIAWGNNHAEATQSQSQSMAESRRMRQRNARKPTKSKFDGMESCYSIEEYHVRRN